MDLNFLFLLIKSCRVWEELWGCFNWYVCEKLVVCSGNVGIIFYFEEGIVVLFCVFCVICKLG